MTVLQKCRKALWALVLIVMGMGVCRADVKITALDDKRRFARIEVTGRITKPDVARFAELVALLRPGFEVLDVDLDSPGGDVFAAMQIGEIVRREWLMTSVPGEPPAEGCMSACVLILADSRVGIHRPYFDQVLFAGLDRTQAKAKYDALSQSVATYLAKMGMSERLHQEMMKVPSNSIRLLSDDESKTFNLSGEDAGYSEWLEDAGYSEWLRAKNIAKCGEANLKEFDAWRVRSEEYQTFGEEDKRGLIVFQCTHEQCSNQS